jgi:hypothetical protein
MYNNETKGTKRNMWMDGEFVRITCHFGKTYTMELQQNYGVTVILSNSPCNQTYTMFNMYIIVFFIPSWMWRTRRSPGIWTRHPQLRLSRAAWAENYYWYWYHLRQILLHMTMVVFGSHLDGVPIELHVVMATQRETRVLVFYFLHLK